MDSQYRSARRWGDHELAPWGLKLQQNLAAVDAIFGPKLPPFTAAEERQVNREGRDL